MSPCILVTGATTPAGRSLLQALDGSCVTLLACDSDPDAISALDEVRPEHRFLVQPSDSPEFVGEIVTLCVREHVDVLVPMCERDQLALARMPRLFEQLGSRLWLAPIPAQSTHSQARRIVQLGHRPRSMHFVGAWLRRIAGQPAVAWSQRP